MRNLKVKNIYKSKFEYKTFFIGKDEVKDCEEKTALYLIAKGKLELVKNEPKKEKKRFSFKDEEEKDADVFID